MRLALTCKTAVQACAVVATGEFCSILPAIAAVDLPEDKFLQLETSLLRDYRRNICLAWNPRLFTLRPQLESRAMSKMAKVARDAEA